MKIFGDISKFHRTSDYLPIFNSIITVESFIIYFSVLGLFKSKQLKKWYTDFGLSAVLADICLISLILIVCRYLYKYLFDEFNIWLFIGLALFIEVIHDVSYYALFMYIPRGVNKMFDVLKDYSKEVNWYAILGNNLTIVAIILIASLTVNAPVNINVLFLILSLYSIPYLINSN